MSARKRGWLPVVVLYTKFCRLSWEFLQHLGHMQCVAFLPFPQAVEVPEEPWLRTVAKKTSSTSQAFCNCMQLCWLLARSESPESHGPSVQVKKWLWNFSFRAGCHQFWWKVKSVRENLGVRTPPWDKVDFRRSSLCVLSCVQVSQWSNSWLDFKGWNKIQCYFYKVISTDIR